MDQVKATIKDLTSHHGHHDTTVYEHREPATTHEHVTPTRHENTTAVLDREVHQEHHHTTIQPIREREVLPEKHSHNILPTEHKEYQHGDSGAVKDRLIAEAAQFKDVSKTGHTEHSHSVQPNVTAEHVHHHVHETIQPVIQKETIQPSIIHTIKPVHEIHHNEPKHHAATALPVVSMADYKRNGGTLTGTNERTDRFDGEPWTESAEQHARHGGIQKHGFDGSTGAGIGAGIGAAHSTTAGGIGSTTRGGTGQRTAGPHADLGNKLDPRVDSDIDGSRAIGADRTREGGLGVDAGVVGAGAAGVGAAAVAGAEAQRHDQNSGRMDPRVDARTEPSTRDTALGGVKSAPTTDNRTGTDLDSTKYRETGGVVTDRRPNNALGATTHDRQVVGSTTTGNRTTDALDSSNRDRLGEVTAADNRDDNTLATSSLHPEGTTRAPATQEYADTHAGSKMDGGVPPNGINRTTDSPHYRSNFEAANVTRDTTPFNSGHSLESKKPSLLEKLNPLK